MTCPFCGAASSKVCDSRALNDSFGERIRRRRQCETCNERFTTYETVELEATIKYKKRAEPKPPKPPKKTPEDLSWIERINRKLDQTDATERMLRGEL